MEEKEQVTVEEREKIRYSQKGGYSKLSKFMAIYPNIGIVRKFGALNMLNLLYLQAEITHLETTLDRIAQEDHAALDPTRGDFYRCWYKMASGMNQSNRDSQWNTFMKIREKLDQYCR